MAKRIVMSSDHKDSQGFIMTKGALEGGAEQINGSKKLPWTINHKRELPPLGRIVNALVEERDAHTYLTAETEKYQNRKEVEWDNSLFIEYFENPAPLISSHENELEQTELSLDPANFASWETFETLNSTLYQYNPDVKIEMHGRKSEIPIPEIVFAVGNLTILYTLLKPFGEKFGGKIAEKLAEDVYEESKKELKKFRDYVSKVMKTVRAKAIPKHKPLNTVFEIPGKPHIELIAKTDDPTLLSKGLDEKRLKNVRDEISKFNDHFAIVKIQFVLSDTGRWKFTYLITEKGEVVGKKECFKERDRLYQRIVLGNK